MKKFTFENPFRPGAGHIPPHLAGRIKEIGEFNKLLQQKVILDNMVLTGLRGVGKTVLLIDKFKPLAMQQQWLWAGTDLSESASVTEEFLALRMITDLSLVTSNIVFSKKIKETLSLKSIKETVEKKLTFENLVNIYKSIPGLVSDKLRGLLELTWQCIKDSSIKGIVFSYDEAQTLCDRPEKDQYPIALLLDVFQSIQKKNIPFMLVLTGLPTLFPKLVESRTFAERMFHQVFLEKLDENESRQAISTPIKKHNCPIGFTEDSIRLIINQSGGYPYFIQFMCKEIFDIFIQQHEQGTTSSVPIKEIIGKLDIDFFSGRWSRATDRQRQLLAVAASLESPSEEFTVQELVGASKHYTIDPFSSSGANQMLAALIGAGLVYKNRHGKYSFAVPLLDKYIIRQNILKEKNDN